MPGVDLVLPDWQWLRDHHDEVQAIVLTHGHEDHIGSIPYLLREFELPVYGTPLTLALLEGKLEEHGVRDRAELHPVTPVEEIRTGPFTVRYHRVSHSIPDGWRWPSTSRAGSCCTPATSSSTRRRSTGRSPTSRGLARRLARGVHVLLSDSTNAEDRGTTGSEREVGPVLDDIVRDAERMVVVACFASHIHRIQQVRQRGPGQRPEGGLPRPEHASERGGGPAARLPAGSRRPGRADRGGRAPRSRLGGGLLHRLAGRAPVGPVPDGRPRAQVGLAAAGGHGGALLQRDPRQRDGDPPGPGRAVPDGGRGLPHAGHARSTSRATRPPRS